MVTESSSWAVPESFAISNQSLDQLTVPVILLLTKLATYSVQQSQESLHLTTGVLFADLAMWYEKYRKKEVKDHKIPFSRSSPSRGACSRAALLSRALTEPSAPPLWRGTSNLNPAATIILVGQGHFQAWFGSQLRLMISFPFLPPSSNMKITVSKCGVKVQNIQRLAMSRRSVLCCIGSNSSAWNAKRVTTSWYFTPGQKEYYIHWKRAAL